ncbi:MerR family DNA-binding protein [Neisseria leonii]|uniref:MerR family DNA-binding protein n=1 Tax=Neisseria leonii TaxID=2995413 RepID=A0A9X4E000_9NEIS|nr:MULTISPECIES: MerR family DNA-binding protein [unclassified Neisseria]MDD9325478.1 MerR family transcriptional regulator [Neisseria sp. 3986]MDD9326932.1 MerR family transcriptional regulator [Neisseria sp. 51.81]
MNISQAAKAAGLSAKQIRDYEKSGLLPPAPRSESGYRRYTAADLDRLRFIAHAREVGFSLAQTAELLRLSADPHRTDCEVKALTAQHIAEITGKIASLQTMLATLQNWHDACAGGGSGECGIVRGLEQA